MYNYLLEIFCEEIPARMQKNGANAIKKVVSEMFQEYGISFKAATAYWTPRRLCLDMRGLSEYSKTQIIERKGPSVDAPQSAIEGFVRSSGLKNIEEAQIVNSKKGSYYLANIVQKGRSVFDIITEHMPIALRKVTWDKTMRWGSYSINLDSLHWVRPIKHITSVIYSVRDGSHIAPFEFAHIKANNYTLGHRFLTNSKVLIVNNFSDYIDQLSKAYVVLNPERRKSFIKDMAENLAFANGLELIKDENLLDEVTNLVEYPVILLGSFPEEFLQLPQRVIQTTIKENQKYFVTKDLATNKLSNKFIICANIKSPNGNKLIVKGNERVVTARLQDALYFYNKDTAENNLDKFIVKLKPQNVSAYPELGTQKDRLKRILKLSLCIAEQFDYKNKLKIERAVELAKADLMSEMVMEFTNLQGYIGREYALKQGEDIEVANAIEEHYKPLSTNDDVPINELSIILALADKIDILAGFWFIGEKPSGSRDPLALRRTALGIVRLLLAQEKKLSLLSLIKKALSNYCAEDKVLDLYNFIADRFKHYLRDEGNRYDAIEAVMTDNKATLLYQAKMIKALILYLDSAAGQKFVQAVKRINNILNEAAITNKFNPNLETETPALELYKQSKIIYDKLPTIGKKDFKLLNELTPYIENFFDKVMVNSPDMNIKNNRMALLNYVQNLTKEYAEFEKLVIS